MKCTTVMRVIAALMLLTAGCGNREERSSPAAKPSVATEVSVEQHTSAMRLDAYRAFTKEYPDIIKDDWLKKPLAVIPFDALGRRWTTWRKTSSKGKIGYYAKKQPTHIEIGVLPMGMDTIQIEGGDFWAWISRDTELPIQRMTGVARFANLALTTMNLTTEIVLCEQARAPTADGSLIAISTDGLRMTWLNFIQCISEPGETLYFGVSEPLGGLVHLAGKGKCWTDTNKWAAGWQMEFK